MYVVIYFDSGEGTAASRVNSVVQILELEEAASSNHVSK
jgi:hypothetical protein